MLYPLSYEGGMTSSDATGTCRALCLLDQRCVLAVCVQGNVGMADWLEYEW